MLTQAPHCAAGAATLRLEGTVDGVSVNDQRPEDGLLSASLSNATELTFDTPARDGALQFNNLPTLPSVAIAIHFSAKQSLFNGQATVIDSGELVAPAGAGHAGQTLCITAGDVGIVDGGSEDGALEFSITGLEASADCTGNAVPVELRGCFQAQ